MSITIQEFADLRAAGSQTAALAYLAPRPLRRLPVRLDSRSVQGRKEGRLMARKKLPLAPVVKTRMARRIIRGDAGWTARLECWGAKTIDGLWDFEREESPGTPWLVYHLPSVADGSYPMPVLLCGTLRACRAFAAGPDTETTLARLKAPTGEWADALALSVKAETP